MAVSDRVGSTNATLVRALMRGDGVLMRPTRPQSAIDAQLRAMMFGNWISSTAAADAGTSNGWPATAAAASSSSSVLGSVVSMTAYDRSGLRFPSPLPNGGRGEVYYSVTSLLVSGAPSVPLPSSSSSTSASTLISVENNGRGSASLHRYTPQAPTGGATPCLRWSFVVAIDVTVEYNITSSDLALDPVSQASATCTGNNGSWVVYDWDLGVFGPSTSVPGLPREYNPSAGDGSDFILVNESASAGYGALPQMSAVAPVINGVAILGEQGKLIPMSPQRTTSIAPAASGSNGVSVSVTGSNGEVVTLLACAVDSTTGGCGTASSPITPFACTVGATGSVTINIGAGTSAPMCVVTGNFTLSNTLGSHMVLQRGVQSLVWGFGTPGAVVTTVFDGAANFTSVVDGSGTWRQALPMQPASDPSLPHNLTFISSTGEAPITITDVLFGDVFFCGGQSNMEFTVSMGFNASAEVAAANDPRYSAIRVFTVGQHKASATPFTQIDQPEQLWTAANSASIGGGGGNWSVFSAVCWYFGRDVFDGLGGVVPVGLISNNYGGTRIEAWMDKAANGACNASSTPSSSAAVADGHGGYDLPSSSTGAAADGVADARTAGVGYDPNAESALWNSMVSPYITGPIAITGWTWFQGESNTGESTLYACLFPSLINSWRAAFNNSGGWFGFVVLQLWESTDPLMVLRESQLAALALDNIGYAAAIDIGDPLSPFTSIHPRHKQPVGTRLSNSALAMVYDQQITWQSPRYSSAQDWGSAGNNLTVLVSFESDSVGSGLTIVPDTVGSTSTHCPTELGVNISMCAWWSIQGSDGVWYNATEATVWNGTQLVVSALVPDTAGLDFNPDAGASGDQLATVTPITPIATAYGWGVWPVITLYNIDGYPALPWNRTINATAVDVVS